MYFASTRVISGSAAAHVTGDEARRLWTTRPAFCHKAWQLLVRSLIPSPSLVSIRFCRILRYRGHSDRPNDRDASSSSSRITSITAGRIKLTSCLSTHARQRTSAIRCVSSQAKRRGSDEPGTSHHDTDPTIDQFKYRELPYLAHPDGQLKVEEAPQ